MLNLAVSIVTYKHNVDEIFSVVDSVFGAVNYRSDTCCQIIIIDNHGTFDWQAFISRVDHFDDSIVSFRYISNPDNNGYGFGNNLAFRELHESNYFLVLNPDAFLEKDSLDKAFSYMERHDTCVLLTPKILSSAGIQESGVKEFPSIFVLLSRLLNIRILNMLFRKQLNRYEARYLFDVTKPIDVKITSGCFMLFKTDCLKALGGFDTRFFMYFEDFDLSLRANKVGRVVYHPDVTITHLGGGAGRKGLTHITYFIVSMYKFFSKHGWKII